MSKRFNIIGSIGLLAIGLGAFALGRLTAPQNIDAPIVTASSWATGTQGPRNGMFSAPSVIVAPAPIVDESLIDAIRKEVRAAIHDELELVHSTEHLREPLDETHEANERIDESFQRTQRLIEDKIAVGRWAQEDDQAFQKELVLLPQEDREELLSRLHMAINNEQLNVEP